MLKIRNPSMPHFYDTFYVFSSFMCEKEFTNPSNIKLSPPAKSCRYNISGFVEELPPLPEIRSSHACAALPATGVRLIQPIFEGMIHLKHNQVLYELIFCSFSWCHLKKNWAINSVRLCGIHLCNGMSSCVSCTNGFHKAGAGGRDTTNDT